MTTTDLKDFGYREREMAKNLLDMWNKQNLPRDFFDDEVEIMMNMNSGNVFLTNSDYQVAMINDDNNELESFYTSPYEGREGFFDDLKKEYDEMHPEDKGWFKALADDKGIELP